MIHCICRVLPYDRPVFVSKMLGYDVVWMILGVISALFLGCYDISKKLALRDNAVLPVLFWATVFGAMMMVPVLAGSFFAPEWMQAHRLHVAPQSGLTHLALFAKAVLVSSSWICAYFAMKHLPISIVTPIRASAPVWTLAAAMLVFHERPTALQMTGMAVVFCSYYAFAVLGQREGIQFRKNRWIGLIVLATLLGTASAVYDKYLIASLKISPITVQAWFAVYLVIVLGLVLLLCWMPRRKQYTPFQWKWSIPAIGILLIIADFAYFTALAQDGALLSMLSILRRSSVVVSFTAGGLLLKESGKRHKALALAGVLAGVLLILLPR